MDESNQQASHWALRQLIAEIAEGRRCVIIDACEARNEYPAVPVENVPESVDVVSVPLAVILEGAKQFSQWLQAAVIQEIDLVCLVAPFGRAPELAIRHDMSTVAALNLLRLLPEHCDVIMALPRHVLAGGSRSSNLHELVGDRHIRSIIDVSGSIAFDSVHPTFRMCLLHLSATPYETTAVISIEDKSLPNLGNQMIKLWAGIQRTSSGFSLAASELDLSAGILPTQVDPDRHRRFAEASVIGDFRQLNDLFEVIHNVHGELRGRREPNAGDVPMVSARHIRSGEIAIGDLREWGSPLKHTVLEAGDLILRSAGYPPGPIVLAEVAQEDLPLVPGRSVIVLRPRGNVGRSELRVLREFLGSNRFALQLRSHQTGSPQLRRRELETALVPMPDADFQAAYMAVDAALASFDAWADECRDLLEMSFDAEDLTQARTQLITATGRLRQRASAARLLDDLGHRVSSRYPFPIAYRWRTAMAARGRFDELKAILHTQEVLLAYLATMALVSGRHGEVEIGYLKDLRLRLGKARGGIGLGDWRGILVEVASSRSFRQLNDAHPLVEVRTYFRDKHVVEASDRLSELRNDEAHLRETGPGNQQALLATAWQDLKTMVSAAEWLTDYPLIRVVETRWDSLMASNTIIFRELAGDSPVVPQSEMISDKVDIEAGSLYARTGRGDLLLLRPLVIGEDCPLCGHWSTFLPDRLRIDGTFEYKGLEHGHTLPTPTTSALAAVGLLDPLSRYVTKSSVAATHDDTSEESV